MSDLVKRYRQLQEVIGGCHDGYCVVRKPKGMHTNGGCTCLEDLRLHERSRIGGLLRCAQGMADRIEELEAKLSESEALLAKAVEALQGLVPILCEGFEDGCGKLSRHDCAACEGYATLAELTSSEAANGEAKGGKDE